MSDFFLKIYRFLAQRQPLMWGLLALFSVLCVIGALRLDFVEDISSFLPNSKENERINYAYSHLGGDNKIMVNIAQADTAAEPDMESLCTAADLLAERLNADTAGLVKSVLYSVDDSQIAEVTDFVVENMPYFLTEEDYARMDTMLTPEHIRQQLANDKQLLASPIPMMRDIIQRDPLFFSSRLLQTLQTFRVDDRYRIEEGHIFDKKGQEALLVITSNYPLSETLHNSELLNWLDQSCREVEQEMEGKVRIHSFGASQVSLTNSQQIKRDSFTALALASLLILALLIYYYRNTRSIVLIFVSTLFGGLFALGVIALCKSTVSLIAIGVASIILGIAINYPIHFLSHFKRTDNKEQIIRDIVTPLLIGNITTVGAFLSLLFISSPAMKDLGLFSALLLVGTILFVLIFLPHLMGDRFKGSNRELAFKRIAETRPENIRGIFWIVLALTIVFAIFSKRTSFDTNMHHINYMTKEQQQEFDKLRAEADTTVQTLYCVAEGTTLQEALWHNEEAQRLIYRLASGDSIQNVSGIGTFFPSQALQQQRTERWNRFWEGRREAFCAALDAAAIANGFRPEAFQPCKDIVMGTYTSQHERHFDPIRQQLAANYISEEKGRVMIYNILQVDKSQAEAVEQQLNTDNKGFFAFTDSSIAARLVDALSHDFHYVLYICGIIVFAFLLFTFGRLEISLMAFLPLFTAWIWILGIMGITGIRFNIVNIILATFIFGMGDDYSIFVTEGLIYEYKYGRKMLSQFKNSIILSSSIMFIGIGMMIFAKHPALRSLAQVTVIGMLIVVLMAYVIPPVVFKWLTTHKGKLRKRPVTIQNIISNVIGFPYFFFGVVVLSIGGFFLLRIGRPTDKHKLQYHKLLRFLLHSTAKIIPNSTFKIENPHQEAFVKPAIIICNHQSHFDLLYLLSLTPNVIALTNDWAWNMPLYRRILRNGDYLPASYGMDQNFPKLQQMVEKGYSILIFPEGTRSVDHSILRFHQGAFHLANKLGLDILPIVTHGIGDMFPKRDTFIHKGDVTIHIGERIPADNTQYRTGKTPLETARAFRQYYIEAYDRMRDCHETLSYLSDLVYHNYIYKGKSVENGCLGKMGNLFWLGDALDQVPQGGRLLYKHCGNGEFALMSALYRRDLDITAYDPDPDCIDLATHCAAVPGNLHYTNVLPAEGDFQNIIDEKDLL